MGKDLHGTTVNHQYTQGERAILNSYDSQVMQGEESTTYTPRVPGGEGNTQLIRLTGIIQGEESTSYTPRVPGGEGNTQLIRLTGNARGGVNHLYTQGPRGRGQYSTHTTHRYYKGRSQPPIHPGF